MQWRQRNLPKSVLHVQRFCFAYFRRCRVALRSLVAPPRKTIFDMRRFRPENRRFCSLWIGLWSRGELGRGISEKVLSPLFPFLSSLFFSPNREPVHRLMIWEKRATKSTTTPIQRLIISEDLIFKRNERGILTKRYYQHRVKWRAILITGFYLLLTVRWVYF